MQKIRLVTILTLLLPFTASAGSDWYNCEVREFYRVSDSGSLEIKSEGYRGETFKVDRLKSVILGDKVNTLYNREIVSSNPETQGVFSLVNYSRKEDGQIRRMSSLTIQDYDKTKPFVFSEGNYIMTGICH